MNFLHIKYAVEIAEVKSINKASETLFVGQPTLSRAIKELEADLGIKIFERSAKGMFLTGDGEVFIRHAKAILKQVDEVENLFRSEGKPSHRFSICCPGASYIAAAFVNFTQKLGKNAVHEVTYREMDAMNAIKKVVQEEYKLGIIRYPSEYDDYYKELMESRGIKYELVAEFDLVPVVSSQSPLAKLDSINYSDLEAFIEITGADMYTPDEKEGANTHSAERFTILERGCRLESLAANPRFYMWTSPIPDVTLERLSLSQLVFQDKSLSCKDVLIRKKDYNLSSADELFIAELCSSRRRAIK